jgi:hypothetical protein
MSLAQIQQGYFSLWPNIATTIAAKLTPLSYAPLITTVLAFLIQIMPMAIILWSRSAYWESPLKKILGVCIILFVPASYGVWLNTINSQFFFTVISYLLLFEASDINIGRKWWYRILLICSGLTGPVSCLLSPFFILKAWKEKKSEAIVQAGIMAACSIIQIFVIWFSYTYDSIPTPIRFTYGTLSIQVIASILWTQSIALTLLNREIAYKFYELINTAYMSGGYVHGVITLGLIITEILFYFFISSGLSMLQKLMFLGSYFLIILLSVAASLPPDKLTLILPGTGGRYFYAPNTILLLTILVNIYFAKDSFKKLKNCILISLLAFALALGLINYKKIPLKHADWPKWKDEIAKWQEQPEYKVKIWPSGWEIKLSKSE